MPVASFLLSNRKQAKQPFTLRSPPVLGRFKGDGCREGGKSKSPLPDWPLVTFGQTKATPRRAFPFPSAHQGCRAGCYPGKKRRAHNVRPYGGMKREGCGPMRTSAPTGCGGHGPMRTEGELPRRGKRGHPGVSAPTGGMGDAGIRAGHPTLSLRASAHAGAAIRPP